MERLTARMPKTRKVRRVRKPNNTPAEPKKTWWVQIRLFPIWLRILLVLVVLALAAAAGAMVGYGIIGDGEPRDALKWETWQHILDVMEGRRLEAGNGVEESSA